MSKETTNNKAAEPPTNGPNPIGPNSPAAKAIEAVNKAPEPNTTPPVPSKVDELRGIIDQRRQQIVALKVQAFDIANQREAAQKTIDGLTTQVESMSTQFEGISRQINDLQQAVDQAEETLQFVEPVKQ